MKHPKIKRKRRLLYKRLHVYFVRGLLLVILLAIIVSTGIRKSREQAADEEPATATIEYSKLPEPMALSTEPVQLFPQTLEKPIEVEPVETEPVEQTYSNEDLEILALIIYQEAGGDACSDDTRMKVGTVLLNRVDSELFPNSIKENVLLPYQYGTLSKTGIVWPERAQYPGEAHAVARAYECAERLLNGERALPADVIWQANFKQGTEVVAFQDNLYFCR